MNNHIGTAREAQIAFRAVIIIIFMIIIIHSNFEFVDIGFSFIIHNIYYIDFGNNKYVFKYSYVYTRWCFKH